MKNKKGFLQGALVGALVTLLILSLASCGLLLGNRDVISKKTEKKLSELRGLIDRQFLGNVDEEALTEGIYKGYLEALDDPYTVYYDEEETKELNESLSGEFSGVGALLSQDRETGIITLIQIYDDSPAMKAGLKNGDILYKVEGKEVANLELNEVVRTIKGEKGTEVNLTVLRGSKGEEITVTAVRDIVKKQTVAYEMLDEKIAHLTITEFDTVTYEQFTETLDILNEQNVKGMIIDLRGNPGGSLSTVCDMLDEILPKGLLVYTEDKSGKRKEYTSDAKDRLEVPLVVLIDGGSASASEIFAGAIQDYEKGEIVGSQSYGKGVVQSLYNLKDGTCVKLTVSEYFTPKGRSINGKGITPDVEVKYEYNEENPEADNQLDKAVEVLKKKI